MRKVVERGADRLWYIGTKRWHDHDHHAIRWSVVLTLMDEHGKVIKKHCIDQMFDADMPMKFQEPRLAEIAHEAFIDFVIDHELLSGICSPKTEKPTYYDDEWLTCHSGPPLKFTTDGEEVFRI